MAVVSLVGLGQIGRLILKNLVRRGYEVRSVIDVRDDLVGRDAGEVALGEKLGVLVTRDIDTIMGSEVVLHSTGSFLDRVYEQLATIIELGANVISTAETLSYPWAHYPILASQLDKRARLSGVTVLGAGINPGFMLDALPIVLAAPVGGLKTIKAVRRLDPANRRPAFQEKVGLGLEEGVYREKLEKGELTGHVGYLESAYLILEALGKHPSEVREWQEPVVAEEDVILPDGRVIKKGMVKGVVGGAKAVAGGLTVEILFNAYIGAGEGETIRVEGEDQTIEWNSTGTNGDLGTAAIVVSLVETVIESEPGLQTIARLLPFRPY